MTDPGGAIGNREGSAPSGAAIPGATVSDARLASVLDTAVDGIVVIDEHARILAFNKSCEGLFGYAAAEVLGQNVKMIMPPMFSARHDDFVHHYLATGERRIIGIGREVTGQRRDGTEFPVELSVGEAVTAEGRQFIGILRDITARKTVEKRLAELQAQVLHMTRLSAIDEMGAAMAHELNQPLTALMLYLQAVTRQLGESPATPPAALVTLDKIVREAERAACIIDRMRNVVEKREPVRQRVDLGAIVAETLELVAAAGQDTAVLIDCNSSPMSLPIDADPIQIQQILVNLLRNGIQASRDSAEKHVTVLTGIDRDRAFVTVADSGPGISEAVASTLFRVFASSKRSGMGLGLAISRSIAQNHGGDLTCDRGGGGTGARFTLHLPLGKRRAPRPKVD